MANSSDARRVLWRKLHQLGLEFPRWVGLDDYSGITGSGFEIPEAEDEGSDLREQLMAREAIVKDLLHEMPMDVGRLGAAVVPMLVGCLSPQTTVALANDMAPASSVLADAIAQVMFARVLAHASRPPFRSIDDILSPLIRSLNRDAWGKLEQQFNAYTSANQAPSAGGETPQATSGKHNRTVIVHGTWAASATWWREPSSCAIAPSDNLWCFLKTKSLTGDLVGKPDEFGWSGNNNDADRRQAGQEFVNWWNSQGQPTLDVVAHSHGGNVVHYAGSLKPKMRIRRLILLGTPSRIEYVPSAQQIDLLVNVYSEHDSVQVPGSWGGQRGEGRTQSEHATGRNLHRPTWQVPNVAAGHSDLHEPKYWDEHRLDRFLT